MTRVGTSGWNYPGGKGTWNGVFYPKPRRRGFDELAYYAEHFDVVEVNSSFYRVPEAPLVQRWVERTPESFLFTVKLFQKFTHPDMFLARAPNEEWNPGRADIDLFRAGIEPLARGGRLGALLLQFPSSLHADEPAREYLSWLLDEFRAYPLAVELRHRSWFEEHALDLTRRLEAGGAALVLTDDPETLSRSPKPEGPNSMNPGTPGRQDSRSEIVYFRFHGRNAAQWWHHEEAEDRYNYLYSPAELRPFAQAAREAESSGRKVFALFNNHFSAKAVANAAVLKSQLGQDLPGEYEPELIRRYPDLEGVVRASGLFI